MDALRPLRQGRGASRTAFTRRSWELINHFREQARDAFRVLSAPTAMHREPQSRTATDPKPRLLRNRTPIEKTRKPRITGLSALSGDFLFQLVKTWHAPCNSPFSDSVHYPVSGTLVQAGRGFPSLHRAHTALATSPPVLGSLVQAGQGIPSLHRAHDAMREPSRFGNLGTGRPGIPSFIALGDGSPAASGHRPRYRPTRPAAAGPPPPSATTPHHSNARASSRSCR